MSPNDLLSNAAAASQNKSLLDDVVTRGAILRSIDQWLRSLDGGDLDLAFFQLRNHMDFDR